MIDKLYSILLLILIFCSFHLRSQDFQWVKQSKGNEIHRALRVACGDAHEVYMARNFSGNVVFSDKPFNSKGGLDFSIVRYNSKGDLDWIISCGGEGDDEIKDIACDKNGEILVAGYFSKTIILDQIQLTSTGKEDVFIAKYDKKGKCKWAYSSGGTGLDVVSSIAIDEDDNILITGIFSHTAKFNGSILEAIGTSDIFVAKYDKKKQLVWLKSIKSLDDRSEPTALAINKNNDVVITGNFYNNLTIENTSLLGDTSLANLNLPNSFLISLDKTGQLMWQNSITSILNDSYIGVSNGLTCDGQGNVYLSGGISGVASAPPFKVISDSPGNQDLFFASCSPFGKWNWIKVSDGEELRYGRDMTTSLVFKDDLIYAVGYFDGLMKLDEIQLNSIGDIYDSDIFIVAFSDKGDFIWWKSAGAANDKPFEFNDVATDVAINNKNEIFVSGWFKGDAKFEAITVKSNNSKDAFLSKIYKAHTELNVNKNDQDSISVIVYPNPVTVDNFNIRVVGTGERTLVVMYDDFGNLIKTVYDGRTKKKESYNFSVKNADLKQGIYQIKVITNNREVVERAFIIK